jgi:acetylglutamate kinase
VKVLVKLGGTLLDTPETRHRLAAEITAMQRSGVEVVVVHGGGKQMTRFLAERGVESRFVGGLRVTTPEVLDAVLKIFAGSVNHELVAAFVQAGARPVGLSGIDACLVEAEPLNPELGAVGRPVRSNPELLQTLTAAGYLPVVACVAGDRAGHVYNVNADQMAVACAAGLRVDKLLFLTDVAGVKDQSGNVIAQLSSAEADGLIAAGVATGGMQAKLNAAKDALRLGVQEVLIAPGAVAGVAGRLLAGESLGSRVVAEGGAHG